MNNLTRYLIIVLGLIFIIVYTYVLVTSLSSGVSIFVYVLPGLLGGLLILLNPFLSLLFILLLSPIAHSQEALLAAKIIGVSAVAVMLLRKIMRRESISWTGLEGPVILMALGMSLSFFRTSNTIDVGFNILSLISLYGLVLVIYNLTESFRHFQFLVYCFLVSSFYPIFQAIIQWVQGPDVQHTFSRISGSFLSPTGFGAFMIPITIIAMAISLYPNLTKTRRFLALGLFGFGCVALILTLSRGAIVGFIIGFTFVLLKLWSQIKMKTLTAAVFLALLFISMWISWPAVKGRVVEPLFDFFTTGTSVTTVIQRRDELTVLIPITLDNKLLGTGIGNYSIAARRYQIIYNMPDLPVVPHNIFLYFFGEVGIFGALGFLWLIVIFFRKVRLSYTYFSNTKQGLITYSYFGTLGSLIGYIPFLLTHTGLFSNEVWISLAILLVSIRLKYSEIISI